MSSLDAFLRLCSKCAAPLWRVSMGVRHRGRINYGASVGCLVRLKTALDRWQIDARRLKSWQRDLRYRAGVVRETYGERRLSELQKIADDIKEAGAKADLSAAGVNRYLAILRHLGRLAQRWGWMERVPEIEFVSGERSRSVALSPVQLRRLVERADPRLAPMILFAALTGMRRGEASSSLCRPIQSPTGKPSFQIPRPPGHGRFRYPGKRFGSRRSTCPGRPRWPMYASSSMKHASTLDCPTFVGAIFVGPTAVGWSPVALRFTLSATYWAMATYARPRSIWLRPGRICVM